jgi:hypothetical protein
MIETIQVRRIDNGDYSVSVDGEHIGVVTKDGNEYVDTEGAFCDQLGIAIGSSIDGYLAAKETT